MDPSVLSSHELTTFHSPPNEDQATISSRAKNIAPTDNDDKNDTRSDVAFQSPASKDREKNLAQIDGGFFAWRYIFLSFLVEGYVWGEEIDHLGIMILSIPLSFGVFLDYPPYSEMTSTMAAIIGTLCTGILYCVGSFVLSLMENFPKSALYLPTIGTLVCSASFLAASYSTNVSPLRTEKRDVLFPDLLLPVHLQAWHLLLCQGIMYGIGGALFFLSEWWVVRRGLAGSIMFAGEHVLEYFIFVGYRRRRNLGVNLDRSLQGTSVFGLILPPVLDWSLKKYGTPMTLRGLGAAFFIGMAPILPFFRGRLPVSVRRRAPPAPTRKYLKRPIFWAFNCLNLLQSLYVFHCQCDDKQKSEFYLELSMTIFIDLNYRSFFVPTLYMPTYATSIGSPGGIVLGLFAGSSIIGQIVTGGLSDHYDLSWIIGVTSVASSVSIFVLWGHSEGFAMLAAFAIVYGISAGGFSCLWQRFAMIIAPSEANSGSLVVYFATSRGIANVLTGPIAGALLQNSPSTKAGYKSLVYYSGSLMILCTLGVSMKGLYRIIRN
ncbi:hypothetical protein PSHT_15663, partial [Puccinia striiformis]